MTCLFAVTTGLPAARAAAMSVCAGSSPPISSTMTSTSGEATRWAGRVGQQLGRDAGLAGLVEVAAGDADELERRPIGGVEAGRAREERPDDRATHGAGAQDSDAQGGVGRHPPDGSRRAIDVATVRGRRVIGVRYTRPP